MPRKKNSYTWEDLPKPINAFTVRNATMRNLDTGEIVQYYSANTKIVVVQKCVTEIGSFYRTRSAEHNSLNWAFEATALGLPNEIAPLVQPINSSPKTRRASKSCAKPASKKTKTRPKKELSNSGERAPFKSFLKRIFKR